MGMTLVINKTVQVGGKQFQDARSIPCDGVITIERSLAAAKTGTLGTRTDNDTGTLVMGSSGHGITTGARLDVYWAGGCRRGMTVGSVSGTSVPIDGGSGDNLPLATTAITAMVPVEIPCGVAGDNVQAYAVQSDAIGGCQVVFVDASDVEKGYEAPKNANQINSWFTGNGVTNQLAGDAISTVFISHGSSVAAYTVRVAVGFNQ